MPFDMPRSGTWEVRGGWIVRALARDLRITLEQAAGIAGNIGGETRGLELMQEQRPQVPGSRGGYGWAQWTGPRRRQFEDFAARAALPPESDEANYLFLLSEFKGAYRNALLHLRGAPSVDAATRVIHVEYETPQDVLDSTFTSFPRRLEYAKRALAGAQAAPTKAGKAPYKVEQSIKAFQREALRLQKALQAQDLYAGELDGDWGPESRTALLAYLKLYHPEEMG